MAVTAWVVWIALIVLAVVALVFVWPLGGASILRRRARARLRARPFPEAWRVLLRERVPLYRRLPAPLRGELEKHVAVFLAEKSFEGCGGMEIGDEVRLRIAAEACVLLLGDARGYYPRLASVLVYPSAFIVPPMPEAAENLFVVDPGVHLDVDDGADVHVGESWSDGAVVLAWDAVQRPSRRKGEGLNVVLHEFAHQLDHGSGLPDLGRDVDGREWARALGEVYDEVCERSARGKPTLIDEYGASDPAEFFAVATEAFFERPSDLRRRYRRLYDALAGYYRLDPAAWSGS
jgi:Mlc titration factor MtfA (ptsG expression regulator)